jgi:hypothetical protein
MMAREGGSMRRFAFLLAAVLVAGAAGDLLAKFGISKTRAMLPRVRPPAARILADAVAVEVRSGSSEVSSSHVALVRGRLEEAVRFAGLFELVERPRDADAVVHVTIDALTAEIRDEIQMERKRVKIGEKQVWDEKKQKYRTEDVYGDREQPVSFRVAGGSVNATVEVESEGDRQTRDASASYSQRFRSENGIPQEASSEESLRRFLVAAAAENAVGVVAYGADPVEVLLAVDGELKDGNRLAEQGRFRDALASWDRARYKGDKEAARLHNVGVAHEAMAYDAPPHAAEHLDELQKAREFYRAARQLDSGEKYFKDPLERIEVSLSYAGQAVELFAEIDRFREERSSRTARSGRARSAAAPKVVPAAVDIHRPPLPIPPPRTGGGELENDRSAADAPLRNGSFESSLSPWSVDGAAAVVSESGRGRVLEVKAGQASGEARQAIGVQLAGSATLSLEYKVTSGEGRVRVLLGYLDTTGRERTSTLEVTAGEGPGAWSPWSVELSALRPRPARATDLKVVVEGGTVRVDNVALTVR